MKLDEEKIGKVLVYSYRVCMTVFIWLVIIGFVIFLVRGRQAEAVFSSQDSVIEEAVEPAYTDTLAYVRDLIYQEGIAQPEIVYAQFLLETGYGSSRILKQNNNCFGMKRARTRPTLAVGTHSGHAVFNSIEDSVKDYALWQNMVKDETRMSEEAYLAMLKRTYAEDHRYVDKLRRIIKTL